MKKEKYPIHPDFKRWAKMNPPLNSAVLPLIQKGMSLLFKTERSSAGVTVEKKTIPSEDGAHIRALLYSPVGIAADAPCLVYFHGGGFVMPAAPYHFSLAREYAVRAKCKVLFADYRLAPKYPFPIPPRDCCSAYAWTVANAKELSVDSSRIAVAGDSAGGELATVVCLMAKDRGLSMPCAQMLIYPVTGKGVETESMKKYTDTPMCNSRDIEKYGKYYIKGTPTEKRGYYSPIHADSLSELPPAYIETAEFDCLRDDGILYAERLKKSGVPTELYNTRGTMHGFDIVLKSPIVRTCVDRRVDFLKKSFSDVPFKYLD